MKLFFILMVSIILLLSGCQHDDSNLTPSESGSDTSKQVGTNDSVFSQVIQVIDKVSGKPINGAKVSIDDGYSCYVPKTTGTTGELTFSTQNGIQTIWVSCIGYVNLFVSPQMSFATYKVYLNPLPTQPKNNTLLSVTNATQLDVLTLLQFTGVVKSLGRYSLKQINLVVGGLGVADFGICMLTPAAGTPPCYAADIVVGLATTATWLASVSGVPDSQLFDFYSINLGTPQIIMLPVK